MLDRYDLFHGGAAGDVAYILVQFRHGVREHRPGHLAASQNLHQGGVLPLCPQGRGTVQGGDLPKTPGGTAIAYKVENALKRPKKP